MRKWFYKPQLNRFDLDDHFVPILMVGCVNQFQKLLDVIIESLFLSLKLIMFLNKKKKKSLKLI